MTKIRTLTALCGLSLAASVATGYAQKGVTVFDDAPETSASAPENGFNIERLTFRYNKNTDVLDVRMQFDGFAIPGNVPPVAVAGDVDGDDDPNAGPNDVANFGIGETFGMAIDIDCDKDYDFIVGVPLGSVLNGTANESLNFVNVVTASELGNQFGVIPAPGTASAVLVNPPSLTNPDILIKITNWSTISRNAEQFAAKIFAYSTNDSRDEDIINAAVNLNFGGRGLGLEFDGKFEDVGVPPAAAAPRRTGWDIERTDFAYDPITDKMKITLRFWGDVIAGDVNADGDPGSGPLPTGGLDQPNLSDSESIAVAFDFDEDGILDTVVGVPTSTNAHNVPSLISEIDPNDLTVPVCDVAGNALQGNLGESFGPYTTTNATAALAHNPSGSDPEFIVVIDKWSELTFTPYQFAYRAFAGSFADQGYGEDNQINSVALEVKRNDRTESFVDALDVGVNPQSNFPISGWDIEKMKFSYNPAGDKLVIDIDYFAIAGDADGNGDPGAMQPGIAGADPANLGNGEAISVFIDMDSDGVEDVVIGISPNGSLDPSTLALEIATPLPNTQDYGAAITTGATAFAGWNPADQDGKRDFQIIVHGWSLLDDTDPNLFGLRVFSGSFADAGFGEDNIPDASNDPPLETKLSLSVIGEGISRDGTGVTSFSFSGPEEGCFNVHHLGANLDGTGDAVILNIVETLEDQISTTGEIFTNFIGDAVTKFPTVLGRSAFFRAVADDGT